MVFFQRKRLLESSIIIQENNSNLEFSACRFAFVQHYLSIDEIPQARNLLIPPMYSSETTMHERFNYVRNFIRIFEKTGYLIPSFHQHILDIISPNGPNPIASLYSIRLELIQFFNNNGCHEICNVLLDEIVFDLSIGKWDLGYVRDTYPASKSSADELEKLIQLCLSFQKKEEIMEAIKNNFLKSKFWLGPFILIDNLIAYHEDDLSRHIADWVHSILVRNKRKNIKAMIYMSTVFHKISQPERSLYIAMEILQKIQGSVNHFEKVKETSEIINNISLLCEYFVFINNQDSLDIVLQMTEDLFERLFHKTRNVDDISKLSTDSHDVKVVFNMLEIVRFLYIYSNRQKGSFYLNKTLSYIHEHMSKRNIFYSRILVIVSNLLLDFEQRKEQAKAFALEAYQIICNSQDITDQDMYFIHNRFLELTTLFCRLSLFQYAIELGAKSPFDFSKIENLVFVLENYPEDKIHSLLLAQFQNSTFSERFYEEFLPIFQQKINCSNILKTTFNSLPFHKKQAEISKLHLLLFHMKKENNLFVEDILKYCPQILDEGFTVASNRR